MKTPAWIHSRPTCNCKFIKNFWNNEAFLLLSHLSVLSGVVFDRKSGEAGREEEEGAQSGVNRKLFPSTAVDDSCNTLWQLSIGSVLFRASVCCECENSLLSLPMESFSKNEYNQYRCVHVPPPNCSLAITIIKVKSAKLYIMFLQCSCKFYFLWNKIRPWPQNTNLLSPTYLTFHSYCTSSFSHLLSSAVAVRLLRSFNLTLLCIILYAFPPNSSHHIWYLRKCLDIKINIWWLE